jgi:hypothetical protein
VRWKIFYWRLPCSTANTKVLDLAKFSKKIFSVFAMISKLSARIDFLLAFYSIDGQYRNLTKSKKKIFVHGRLPPSSAYIEFWLSPSFDIRAYFFRALFVEHFSKRNTQMRYARKKYARIHIFVIRKCEFGQFVWNWARHRSRRLLAKA